MSEDNGKEDAFFQVAFAASVDALAGARSDFTRWLTSVGVSGEAFDDLSVLFSELGSNAIHAASETGEADVFVRAAGGGHDVTLEVLNAAGDSNETTRRWDLDDTLRTGGRGLLIVGELADGLDVDQEEGRLLVRCRRQLHR